MDKKVKIAIAVVVTCLLAFGAALVFSQDVTVFIDGVEVEIPEGKRLVLVPDHWVDEEIYRESHRAEGVELLLPQSVVCDPDELVISPGSCPE